jgi:hypothetical protein
MSELNRRPFLQSNAAALALPDTAPAAPQPPATFRH